jgi:hypothetical protein
MTPDTVTVTTELPAGDAEPASATTVATTPSGARTVIISMPDATSAAAAATGQAAEAPTGHSWLTWLSATGVLAGLAMMLFGHRIRNRFRSNVVTVAVTPAPRRRKADVARGRLAQAAPAAIPQPQPITAEPKEVRAPKVSVPQGGEPVKIDVELPAASSPTGFELREIPPTSAPATGGYEYAISADLIDHVLEEDDPTARDLQTISEEGGDISRFSMVNDFERQIFAQDYEAAMIATGHFTKGFSEFQKSSDDEQPEPEFKASKAS